MADRPIQQKVLDRKIDILKLGNHVNSKGGIDTQSYGPFLSGIPAQKRDISGTEKPIADRETATGIAEFTIRYRNDLTQSMRLICEGTEYDIEAIREGEGRRQWTVIDVKKRN